MLNAKSLVLEHEVVQGVAVIQYCWWICSSVEALAHKHLYGCLADC